MPHHSSLTRIRVRYGLAVIRRFFEAIVAQCQQAGLVWGRELSFDATQVQADASLDSLTARFAVEARQAQQARKARQAEAGREQGQDADARTAARGPQQVLEAHLAALFPLDEAVAVDIDRSVAPTAATELTAATMPTAPTCLPLDLSAPLRGELEAANAARHDWIEQEGRKRREVRGVYQRTADLRSSTTDLDVTPMRLKGGGTHLG